MKDNKDVVLQAVKNNGIALMCASARLKDDKEVVLQAMNKDGCALQYASVRLRDDKEVVLQAVLNRQVVWKYSSQRVSEMLHIKIASGRSNLKDAMSLAVETMQQEDEDMNEYLDTDLSDFLSVWAKKWPSLSDKAEEIVAYIHNPNLPSFTHTRNESLRMLSSRCELLTACVVLIDDRVHNVDAARAHGCTGIFSQRGYTHVEREIGRGDLNYLRCIFSKVIYPHVREMLVS